MNSSFIPYSSSPLVYPIPSVIANDNRIFNASSGGVAADFAFVGTSKKMTLETRF